MKANELRIGNLIGFKENSEYVCEVYLITSDEIGVIVNDVADGGRIDDFVPIELTDEWLIKFGFIYSDGLFYDKEARFSPIYRRHIYYGLNNGNLGCREFQYVHELQNIYFALRGKELNVKKC